MERTVAGLDLGTSTIKVAVAKIRSDGHMDLLGLHEAGARGISKGNIIDLAEASSAVENLMSEVKGKHGPKIFKVVLSIGGVGFSSDKSKASLVLQNSPRELTQYDVEKVIQTARNMNFSLDRFILHEIVEDYILDGQEGVKNPAGLFAKRLELNLYTLFHNTAHIQNAVRCVNYAGFDVERITFSGFVGINCMVNEDELKNGVVSIDIGYETTKIVVVAEDRIRYCSLLDMGSADVTRSISAEFKLPFASAERLKFDSGIAMDSTGDEKISIVIENRQKEILKSEVNDIVRKKTEQLLSMVRKELADSSFLNCIKSGIVISGGGALLGGLPEKVENFFGLSARIGALQVSPLNIEQPPHLFASSIGALEYYTQGIREKSKKFNFRNPISKLTHKISIFIEDYF